MFNFLKSNRPESTMRVNVTLIGIGCFLILAAIGFHIVWFSFKLQSNILWAQIAIALGGIATLMTGVLWQKTEQKKVENVSPLNNPQMKENNPSDPPPVEPDPNDPRPR